jgi:flagellar biosynthesis protein FlhG
MTDQATELRRLVLRAARDNPPARPVPSRLIVVSGGHAGAGVTTLTLGLAAAMSDQAARVVLVDADPYEPQLALRCGLEPSLGLADVLSARRGIHEVLQRGPLGLLVLPGILGSRRPSDSNSAGPQRLIRQLRALGHHAEIVLVDVGHGGGELLTRFWQAADLVLLVVTPQPQSLLDAYAVIKRQTSADRSWALQLIVNRVPQPSVAGEIHPRLDRTCRRFLGLGLGCLGWVPRDETVVQAQQAAVPLPLWSPGAPAAQALDRLATRVLSHETMSSVPLAADSDPAARRESGKVAISS